MFELYITVISSLAFVSYFFADYKFGKKASLFLMTSTLITALYISHPETEFTTFSLELANCLFTTSIFSLLLSFFIKSKKKFLTFSEWLERHIASISFFSIIAIMFFIGQFFGKDSFENASVSYLIVNISLLIIHQRKKDI